MPIPLISQYIMTSVGMHGLKCHIFKNRITLASFPFSPNGHDNIADLE